MKRLTIFFFIFILLSSIAYSIEVNPSIIANMNNSGGLNYVYDSFNTSDDVANFTFLSVGSNYSYGIKLPSGAQISYAGFDIRGHNKEISIILNDVPSLDDGSSNIRADSLSNPDTVQSYGACGGYGCVDVRGSDGATKNAIIMFDIRTVPVSAVSSAEFQWYLANFNGFDSGDAMNVSLHHVYPFPNYNNTPYDFDNPDAEVWNSTNYTWNTRPSTDEQMNLTPESSVNFTDTAAIATMYGWSMTNALNRQLEMGGNNITLYMNFSELSGIAATGETVEFGADDSNGLLKIEVNYTTLPINTFVYVEENQVYSNAALGESIVSVNDFSAYLQTCIDTLAPDANGYVTCALNVSSDAGSIEISNFVVNYTFDNSSSFVVFDWWNETTNLTLEKPNGRTLQYRIREDLFPTADLNITGFKISDGGTSCLINGVSMFVNVLNGYSYCNVSNPYNYMLDGSFYFSNTTTWDNTFTSVDYSVNQSNTTQYQASSPLRQVIDFNVSFILPNSTISDEYYGKPYNVTTYIQFSDDAWIDATQNITLYYLNYSFEYDEINVSNRCVDQLEAGDGESNYSMIVYDYSTFWACYNVSDDTGKPDYVKVLIGDFGNFSLAEFEAVAYQDITEPVTILTEPTGVYTTSTGIPLSWTTTDANAFTNCWYNITDDTDTLAKIDTAVTCTDVTSTFDMVTNDVYVLYLYANDSYGNVNWTTIDFTINVPAPSPPPSGGGGGGVVISGKRDCNITITPNMTTLTRGNRIARITIQNFENTSIVPSYTVQGSVINVTTIAGQENLLGLGSVDFAVYASPDVFLDGEVNESMMINESVIVGSSECNDLSIMVSVDRAASAGLDFKGIMNTIVASVNIADFEVRIYTIMALFSILTIITIWFFLSTLNLGIKILLSIALPVVISALVVVVVNYSGVLL